MWYNLKCKEQGRAKKNIFLANNKKSRGVII